MLSSLGIAMLIYLPLYKKGAPTGTIEERRKALLGYVYSPYRMNDLMNRIVPGKLLLDFEIYDGVRQSPDQLLYRSFALRREHPLYTWHETMQINGRSWYINFYSTPAFDASQDLTAPLLITLAGLAIYLFLLFIITALIKSRTLMLEQADTLNKLTQALEQSPNTTIITDTDGTIEYVNAAFIDATGYAKEEVIGQRPSILRSGKTPDATFQSMWETLSAGEEWHGEFINRRKDGTEYVEAVRIAPVVAPDGKITHYMAVQEDITEKKQIQERVHYLANYDALTGLPNRYQLMERLKYTISDARRNRVPFAVMFLDLDHFKDINDTLGHSVGDALLVELSKRFTSILRDVDTISRLGGDEFIFILPDTDADGAAHVARKMLGVIDKMVKLEQNELIVTASVGISVYPDDGSDAETLSKNADTAMYRAKKEGRNRYAFYTQEMQLRSSRNLLLTNALHHALARDEFYMVYQPQIRLRDDTLVGAEALIRWRHPEFGEISPAEFIPLAEESGLIIPIGEWVLRQSIMQAKEWNGLSSEPMTVAVNLSAVQFRLPNLTETITGILGEIGLEPRLLELELTETIAMHDPQSAYTIMSQLDSHGIRIAIDDFGTGHSSLSYLKKFKLSKLKIDQSFIRDISTDPEDKAIVSATINLARSLGLKTIAEGVETVEQLSYLRTQKCDKVQGYYFSRPLDTEQFEAYLHTWNAKRPD
jgi:diguanylate cyclase (GGDEF)-like protein/PAS domain S-box-containing protein